MSSSLENEDKILWLWRLWQPIGGGLHKGEEPASLAETTLMVGSNVALERGFLKGICIVIIDQHVGYIDWPCVGTSLGRAEWGAGQSHLSKAVGLLIT